MPAEKPPRKTIFTMTELIEEGKKDGVPPAETRINIQKSLDIRDGDIKELPDGRLDLSGLFDYCEDREKNPKKTVFTVRELRQLFHAPESAIQRAIAGSAKDKDGHIVDVGKGRYDLSGMVKWMDAFQDDMDRKAIGDNPLPPGKTIYTMEEIIKVFKSKGESEHVARETVENHLRAKNGLIVDKGNGKYDLTGWVKKLAQLYGAKA